MTICTETFMSLSLKRPAPVPSLVLRSLPPATPAPVPGQTLSPDDERLLGVLATQLAFVAERRASAQELQALAAEGARSVQDWRALLADRDRRLQEASKWEAAAQAGVCVCLYERICMAGH